MFPYAYIWVCLCCVSAVVLQVHHRCLSFSCFSPASINRSVCVLQFLRGFVLVSFFSPYPYPLLPPLLHPGTLFGCLSIYHTAILGCNIITEKQCTLILIYPNVHSMNVVTAVWVDICLKLVLHLGIRAPHDHDLSAYYDLK